MIFILIFLTSAECLVGYYLRKVHEMKNSQTVKSTKAYSCLRNVPLEWSSRPLLCHFLFRLVECVDRFIFSGNVMVSSDL